MNEARRTWVIGSRGSALALWQANEAARLLPVPWKIRVIETAGDRLLDTRLQGRVEKGFFTKEIEDKLLDGEIDVAVHSLKDLPTEAPPGLVVAACLPRGPAGDLLLVHPRWLNAKAPFPVKTGAIVGTGSLRRQALLRVFAPSLLPALIRGNVSTRIGKCDGVRYGAVILAQAGINRLRADPRPCSVFEVNPELWLPAPGQGAIALEARSEDRQTLSLLAALDHAPTRTAVTIERRLLAGFEGGCHTAFGAHAQPHKAGWSVRLGLDAPGRGWICAELHGDEAGCASRIPSTLAGQWKVPAPGTRWLCRPVQW
jgi:hydroxymethylbilane synthase